MFSYLLLFLSIIPFLSRGKTLKLENKIYSLIITSALFSYTILGLISLIFISFNKSRFPILIPSIIIFLLTLFFNNNSQKVYKKIKEFIFLEFKKFKYNFKLTNQKKSIIIILILLILITLSSIGPINHPDALDYHVGYPFQYWLKEKFFIDEGFHQALMGAGDYANLSFIQEKTIWLIRYVQIYNLPLITLFFINNLKNKLNIIAFLSSATFIQWSTIGKPLFLSESSCAIAYIIWREHKDEFSKRLLIICLISCISIKISSLIVCFPITLDIIVDTLKNKKKGFLKKLFIDKSIFLSLLILLSVLFSRYIIIGNFTFPLLTNIFNKNDILINNFVKFLAGYQRDGLFPLNIFIPLSFKDIASSIGPGISLIIIFLIIKTLSNIKFKEDMLFYIGFSQIFLLILFCQGRADYYALPIIICIYFADNINIIFQNKFLKSSINLSIYFQLILITGFLIFSINQNFLSLINYEKTMSSISYGYDFSKLINTKTSGNIYQNVIRDTRLFYPKNYISREQISRCIEDNNSKEFCLEKYNVTQIINKPNIPFDKKNYSCREELYKRGARNPINRDERKVEVCEKIGLF